MNRAIITSSAGGSPSLSIGALKGNPADVLVKHLTDGFDEFTQGDLTILFIFRWMHGWNSSMDVQALTCVCVIVCVCVCVRTSLSGPTLAYVCVQLCMLGYQNVFVTQCSFVLCYYHPISTNLICIMYVSSYVKGHGSVMYVCSYHAVVSCI